MYRELLLQYRLRADIVPHLLKLVEGQKESTWVSLVKEVRGACVSAAAMHVAISQYNEKQMNRLQSFQYRLSSELVKLKSAMDHDPQLAKSGEYASLKEQLDRAEQRIATARQAYMADGPAYNSKLAKTPRKWFNQWIYKFQPLPVSENSAVH